MENVISKVGTYGQPSIRSGSYYYKKTGSLVTMVRKVEDQYILTNRLTTPIRNRILNNDS